MTRSFLSALLLATGLVLGAPALAQTADEIAAVQSHLAARGYEPGPDDGLMGSRSRAAIEAFETDRGRTPTGTVSPWIIGLATGTAEEAAPEPDVAEPKAAAVDDLDIDTNATIAVPDTNSDPDSPVSALLGDPAEIAGNGPLGFSDNGDGSLLVTDGIPWRAQVFVEPRTITIDEATSLLFKVRSGDILPVPLDGKVIDVPGTLFVPLFLAHDQTSAARASLADTSGMTWVFSQGGLRFERDDFTLEAAEPGATMVFTPDGMVLTGFNLTPG
ncbi:MAG: peptidoglycan-binding protein [Rhodospirillales bacterium]|nr:peptidoglycan-binding protein [Rhodospirillales bacterium]